MGISTLLHLQALLAAAQRTRIPKARDKDLAHSVDHLCIVRNLYHARVADSGDAAIIDYDR
jgi:hypothetical protein